MQHLRSRVFPLAVTIAAGVAFVPVGLSDGMAAPPMSSTVLSIEADVSEIVALVACGECDMEIQEVCNVTFSQPVCHEFEDGDIESPDARGEDWHYVLSNNKVGGEGECEEHPECDPGLALLEITTAVERGSYVDLIRAVSQTAGAWAEFDANAGKILVYASCKPHQPAKVVVQIEPSAVTRHYWAAAAATLLQTKPAQ